MVWGEESGGLGFECCGCCIGLGEGRCVFCVGNDFVECLQRDCFTSAMLCCGWFETEFSHCRHGEIAFRPGEGIVGFVIRVSLYRVDVRIGRRLSVIEIKGGVSGVRQRFGTRYGFGDVAELFGSLVTISP